MASSTGATTVTVVTAGTQGPPGIATTVIIVGVDLTGTKNGVNLAFTIPDSIVTNSEQIIWNGVTLRRTTGYTISGSNITMTTAPTSNDTLTCNYVKSI